MENITADAAKISIAAVAAAQISSEEGGEDRISTLPDAIIHHILERLQPQPEHIAQLNILSKRWSQLIQSYPILELRESWTGPLDRDHRNATAILEKMSQGTLSSTISTVRIHTIICSGFYYDFFDHFLDFVAEFSLLREIDIKFGVGCNYSPDCYFPDSSVIPYSIPKSFFTPNGKQFARLVVLKLRDCRFDLYENSAATNFSCLGRSLKVLCLDHVEFPNEGILHDIIGHASLLETLTLRRVEIYHWKFRIRNHPNLRVLKLSRSRVDLLEIGGIRSLEEVRVIGTCMKGFKIWSTPNLKVVCGKGNKEAGALALDDFISKQIGNVGVVN